MLIECRSCAQKNRVQMKPAQGRAVCGKCGSPLDAPSYVSGADNSRIIDKSERTSFVNRFRLFSDGAFAKFLGWIRERRIAMAQWKLEQKKEQEAKIAKEKVDEAKRLVESTGVAEALSEILLDEIKYWPSWVDEDKFLSYVNFDASDIVAHSQIEDCRSISRVSFKYKGRSYIIVLRDKGRGFMDADNYGEAELYADGSLVLGIDIARRRSDEFGSFPWEYFNVNAFVNQKIWMKDLLEMATQIKSSNERRLKDYYAEQVIERAKNIKL